MGYVVTMPLAGVMCGSLGWPSVFYLYGKPKRRKASLTFDHFCINKTLVLLRFIAACYSNK